MENPYLDPTRIRAALRSLGLRPTREMGQNFLTDANALETIVAAAGLAPNDTVIEIGPGLGVLTWELLQRAERVVAVELDRRLTERLSQEFAQEPRLTVVHGDILKQPPGDLLLDERPKTKDEGHVAKQADSSIGEHCHSSFALRPSSYKVVANLPYAITSAALRHFLEAEYKPATMVVLVQWEVAQRIVARPGDMSVLAHSVQIYAEPEIVARVPASSFVPAPAVDSAVLRLKLRPHPAIDVEVAPLMRLIKAGFLQARKKLANALPTGLASLGIHVEKERAVAALTAAGVDPNRRAETLALEEWVQVYRALFNDQAPA
jgi:16S rRNA (adenine1518-N6/adenine1519-N6)-dimethyltransferase